MLGTNFFSAGRGGWWQKGYPQLAREAEIRKKKYAAGMRLGQYAVAGNTPVGTVPGAKSVQSSEIKDGQLGQEISCFGLPQLRQCRRVSPAAWPRP